jgi:hypothetical protein
MEIVRYNSKHVAMEILVSVILFDGNARFIEITKTKKNSNVIVKVEKSTQCCGCDKIFTYHHALNFCFSVARRRHW